MKRRAFFFLMALVAAAYGMTACSEEDDTVEEFPNWQATNEAYFNRLTDSVRNLISLNPARTDWQRIKCWSKDADTEGSNGDYIIVNVLEEGDANSACPLYTDTVSVHYLGRLLPSVSYPQGFVFQQTYTGDFDADVARPVTYPIGTSSGAYLVDGMATALQHMHRGDYWRVYIPYQLGYGASGRDAIPGYSTLIFDLRLVDFWSPVLQEE